MASVPKVPLCTFLRLRRSTSGNAAASGGHVRRRPHPRVRDRIVELERVHVHVAAEIRTIGGDEPGLERDEGRRRGGVDHRAVRVAGLRVEAARDVQREDRHRRRVGPFDPARVRRTDGASEADAEHAIDDEPAAPALRQLLHGAAAGRGECPVCGSSVGRQACGIAREHDRHVAEPRAKMPRRDESVAAVVAGTCEHQHLALASGEQIARDSRGGGAGTLHQRCIARGGLDLPERIDGEDGGEGGYGGRGMHHGVDYRAAREEPRRGAQRAWRRIASTRTYRSAFGDAHGQAGKRAATLPAATGPP